MAMKIIVSETVMVANTELPVPVEGELVYHRLWTDFPYGVSVRYAYRSPRTGTIQTGVAGSLSSARCMIDAEAFEIIESERQV